jgi:hypothetical protein
MTNPDLILKIKNAIKKSGFPLELKIGNSLEKLQWDYSIGNIFRDFETGKYRESDIVAEKIINGILVKLFIECKKSDDKQLILYAPKNHKNSIIVRKLLKTYPKIKFRNPQYDAKSVFAEFQNLPLYDSKVPFAKSLIVTKGDTVTEDNIKFVSSINGLVKNSVITIDDDSYGINERTLYLHFFIFEGQLFQLSNSETEDFDLQEISYGQFQYEAHLQVESNAIHDEDDTLAETVKSTGSTFIIEFISADKFSGYVKKLEKLIGKINPEQILGWGKVATE